MRKIEILIDGKARAFTGPSSWAEVPEPMASKLFELVKAGLTKKHLLFAVPMLIYGIPYQVMKIFIDARVAFRKYQAGDDSQNWESLTLLGEDLLASTNWVYSEQPPSTWLLNHINVNGRNYNACSDKLHNLTFGDFIFTEDYAAKDQAKLCAAIYQKRGFWPGTHKRTPIVHADVEKLAAKLRAEKFNTVRMLVAWNYAGMIQHLKQVFTHVFGKPSDSIELAQQPVAATNQWMEAALEFAENDPIKFHALEKENLYVALKMINNRILQNKKREAEIQNRK